MPLEICPSSNDICESFLVVCHLLLLLNICDDVQHIFWKMLFNKLEQVRDVVCIYVEYKDECFCGLCNIKYINRGTIASIKTFLVKVKLRLI